MDKSIINDHEYLEFIYDVKHRVYRAQIKAAVSVNRELLSLYWDIASQIVEKQKKSTWGNKFIEQISMDLQKEFPDMKGFSLRNLQYMRQWYFFLVKVIFNCATTCCTNSMGAQSRYIKYLKK